jgi:hypothetical protein
MWWRYSASGEGKTLVYVDCNSGDDIKGKGTKTEPYQHINFALKGGNSLSLHGENIIPSTINWRGLCSETIIGNHNVVIQGDYWGAAVYDGKGSNGIYFSTLKNVIVRNSGQFVDIDYNLSFYGSYLWAAFAGVGRAYFANYADNASYVYGVCASPVQIENSRLWRGCIGGDVNVHHNVYSKIKANANNCGVTLGTYSGSATMQNKYLTIYDVDIQNVSLSKSANTMPFHGYRCLFGKYAIIYELSDYFYNCFFTSDCEYYYVDKSEGEENGKRLRLEWKNLPSQTETSFVFEERGKRVTYNGSYTDGVMVVSGANIKSVYDAFMALYGVGRVILDPATKFLNNCVFSSSSSEDIWNDPENGDFTIQEDSDAVIDTVNYYGALSPALSIPIVGTGDSGSDQIAGCWDNRSADGCVSVNNGVICIDPASSSEFGSIRTKIIKTDPTTTQFNGVFCDYSSGILRGWIANQVNPYGEKLMDSGCTLAVDSIYLVKGGVVSFNGDEYNANTCISTKEFTEEQLANMPVMWTSDNAYLMHVIDPNIQDCLYCRCRSMAYAYARVGDTLLRKVTYLNSGDQYILFHGRVIVPGESFICKNDGETFLACDSDGNISDDTSYEIAIIFDDRDVIPEGEHRIGGETEWVPAQLIGEYFAIKSEGSIQQINVPQLGNIPAGSGNYRSYAKSGNGAAVGGNKSILNQVYLQFALFVTKISEIEINEL